MQPHHFFLLPRTHDLERRGRLLFRLHHRIIHGREIRLVDLDVGIPVPVAGFLFRQPDGTDFRVREDDRGDIAVVEFGVFVFRAAEEAVAELAAGGDGDGGQFNFAADVAEGVDVVDVCVLVVVDDDVALLVLLHARFFQAEVFDFGGTADGPEEAVDVEGVAVRGGFVRVVHRHPFVVLLFDFGLRAVAVDVDALALVLFNNGFLDHGVEGAEEGFVADEEMGFAAEVVEHSGHFDGDVACAYQGDAFGQRFEVEESVRCYAHFSAGGFGDVGMAACGEEDLFGADGFFAAVVEDHFNLIFGEDVSPAVEVFDMVFLEIFFIDAIETFYVVVSFVLECLEVKWCSFLDLETVGYCFM